MLPNVGCPQFLSFAELLHSVGAARAVHWSGRFSMKYKIAIGEYLAVVDENLKGADIREVDVGV